MTLKNKVYVDKTLPFGVRSAPEIFSAITDALEWVMHNKGIANCLHYLDDFLTMCAPGSEECLMNLRKLSSVCGTLDLP